MSWSVAAGGKPEEVRERISGQFDVPMVNEPDTAAPVKRVIMDVLDTFDPEHHVNITANAMTQINERGKPYQNVILTISS